MHLAEPAAVFKSGPLKPPYDGVPVDPVIRLFFRFFSLQWLQKATSTTELTHSIRLARFTRFARPSLKMRLASLGASQSQESQFEISYLDPHIPVVFEITDTNTLTVVRCTRNPNGYPAAGDKLIAINGQKIGQSFDATEALNFLENIDLDVDGMEQEVCLTYENSNSAAGSRSNKGGWLTGAVLGDINDEPVLLHTKTMFKSFLAGFKEKYFDSKKGGEKKITFTFLELINDSEKEAMGRF